jgi:hypothetical protein
MKVWLSSDAFDFIDEPKVTVAREIFSVPSKLAAYRNLARVLWV